MPRRTITFVSRRHSPWILLLVLGASLAGIAGRLGRCQTRKPMKNADIIVI